jgi:YqaJ-like recombinase protein
MIVHYDIVQGTEAWHRIRYGKIGGTCADGLLKKTDTLLVELLSAHMEPFEMDEDSYESPAMLRGTELEPVARQRLSEITGIVFKEAGWLQCEENYLLGISPDGISEDLAVQCEFKCPGRNKHTEYLLGGVLPLDHANQCVHNFTVNPHLEKLYFMSFRPESRHQLFKVELTRDSVVNLGTKATPKNNTIREWTRIIRAEANVMKENITTYIKNLDKI